MERKRLFTILNRKKKKKPKIIYMCVLSDSFFLFFFTYRSRRVSHAQFQPIERK